MNRRSFIQSAAALSTALVVAPRSLAATPSRIREMHFYEVDGRTAFPVFGQTGVMTTRVAILPCIFEQKFVTTVLMFGHYIDDLLFIRREHRQWFMAEEMDRALRRFDYALRTGHTIIDREEGPAVPDDGQVVRFYRKAMKGTQ